MSTSHVGPVFACQRVERPVKAGQIEIVFFLLAFLCLLTSFFVYFNASSSGLSIGF